MLTFTIQSNDYSVVNEYGNLAIEADRLCANPTVNFKTLEEARNAAKELAGEILEYTNQKFFIVEWDGGDTQSNIRHYEINAE